MFIREAIVAESLNRNTSMQSLVFKFPVIVIIVCSKLLTFIILGKHIFNICFDMSNICSNSSIILL